MSEGLDPALLAARFCALTLGIVLFGQACFRLYAPPELESRPGPIVRLIAPALAAAATAAWLLLLARAIGGAAGLPDPGLLWRVVASAAFGRALAVAALLGIGLLVAGAAAPERLWPPVLLSGAMLSALVLVGHAASGVGAAALIREGLMAAHLLAAGAWLGGLVPLALAIRRPHPAIPALLNGFGRMAFIAVMVVLGSGLVSLLEVVVMSGGGVGPRYLRVLIVKLLLVGALLAIAAVNRLWLTPLAERKLTSALGPMRISLALEQLVALALVASATLLGQLDPSM